MAAARMWWAAAVAAVALLAAAAHAERPSQVYQPPMVQLNDSNFDALVGQPGTRWVVEFYADWCGHCNNLAPSYQELATRVAELKADAAADGDLAADAWYNVTVGAVNVDRAPGLSVRFQITGIPRLFVIDGSTVYNYPAKQRNKLEQPLETGEWKTESVLQGGFIAPFGAVAQIISYVARAGMWALTLSETIKAQYGVPQPAQAIGFLVLVVVASFVVGIVIQMILDALLPRQTAPAAPRSGPAAAPETKKTK